MKYLALFVAGVGWSIVATLFIIGSEAATPHPDVKIHMIPSHEYDLVSENGVYRVLEFYPKSGSRCVFIPAWKQLSCWGS